jgi:hypothetical protein
MRDDNKKKVSALAMAVAGPEAKPAGIKGKGKGKGKSPWWAQPKNTTGAMQFTGILGVKVAAPPDGGATGLTSIMIVIMGSSSSNMGTSLMSGSRGTRPRPKRRRKHPGTPRGLTSPR